MPDNDLEMREKERCSRSSLPHVEEEFIKTTYDISLDSQISLFPDGFSLRFSGFLLFRVVFKHNFALRFPSDPEEMEDD